MSTLRWKLALFILNHLPFWVVAEVFVSISIYKPSWTFWTCFRDSIRIENELDSDDSIVGYYLLAVILFPIWFPLFSIDYFLITTYYCQFPESLI